jgi:hypothetical protein
MYRRAFQKTKNYLFFLSDVCDLLKGRYWKLGLRGAFQGKLKN